MKFQPPKNMEEAQELIRARREEVEYMKLQLSYKTASAMAGELDQAQYREYLLWIPRVKAAISYKGREIDSLCRWVNEAKKQERTKLQLAEELVLERVIGRLDDMALLLFAKKTILRLGALTGHLYTEEEHALLNLIQDRVNREAMSSVVEKGD